jgi:NCAIR mutase (PurE)-related protein
MTQEQLRKLLEEVADGRALPDAALDRLTGWPAEPVSNGSGEAWARLDHQRTARTGMPEVVLAAGKTVRQVVEICARFAESGAGFLVTRADDTQRAALAGAFPAAYLHDLARIVHLPGGDAPAPTGAAFAVVSAGTADLPVAEEAAITAAALGHPVACIFDVGVAGLHRVLEHRATLQDAGVVIVVAGMEGALPSVVGGLIGAPVIAVPTSTGYGTAFGGVAALLGMLNSCAAGVTVVNIDNGFGAACAAARILKHTRARN